jgi:hypothetical protein
MGTRVMHSGHHQQAMPVGRSRAVRNGEVHDGDEALAQRTRQGAIPVGWRPCCEAR